MHMTCRVFGTHGVVHEKDLLRYYVFLVFCFPRCTNWNVFKQCSDWWLNFEESCCKMFPGCRASLVPSPFQFASLTPLPFIEGIAEWTFAHVFSQFPLLQWQYTYQMLPTFAERATTLKTSQKKWWEQSSKVSPTFDKWQKYGSCLASIGPIQKPVKHVLHRGETCGETCEACWLQHVGCGGRVLVP